MSEGVRGRITAEWIRANAIPLRTVEAGHGFDDIEPLRSIIANARVVALGEATHGSREFFQLKHRMIEFLATRMGFSIFSIEANMPEAYRLNDYVLRGIGDPRELIRGMYFWTWQTEEVLRMVLWMREFNRSGKGRIEFTGFDMQFPTLPMSVVRSYVAQHRPAYLKSLDPALELVASLRSNGPDFGVATATLPVQAAAGRSVTLSGYIKTEAVVEGYAGLWMRVDGSDPRAGIPDILAFDNMRDRGARGTTPWTRYRIQLEVPPNARNINFGVLHVGQGTAWFDSLALEIDGVPYIAPNDLDLDFESDIPRGFSIGGRAYKVSLDAQTVHSGRQSLRSVFMNGPPQQKLDSAEIAERWRRVIHDLESMSGDMDGDERTRREFNWVLRNASLVLQFAELRTDLRSRDRSMAENVRWIADQNPGKKIVLWAHNEHVAHGRLPSHVPMGEFLKKAFGKQFVSVGFVFDQGSFRAQGERDHVETFAVGPAPDGSLDQILASTGLPLFALDLRKAPTKGPVGEWLGTEHATRNIGSMFVADRPAQYMVQVVVPRIFDVLLFVNEVNVAQTM